MLFNSKLINPLICMNNMSQVFGMFDYFGNRFFYKIKDTK